MRLKWPGLRPQNLDLRPDKPNLRPERPDLRPVRLDLKPERLNLKPQRPGLRSQRPDLRPEGLGEGGTNKRTDGRTDERKSPCVLQDFVPFGAAALLPLTPIHNHAKQGNGYR